MRLRRPFAALAIVALLLTVLTATGRARGDALGELEKAHSAYVAHQYANAEGRLRALLDASTGTLKDPDSVADARMYLAAVLIAQGKRDGANAVLEQLLVDKSDYQPDPLRVSLDAINALIDSRTRLRERLAEMQVETVRKEQEVKARLDAERQKAASRLSMLERLASEEIVVERNSRWLALVPFGAGQFQNGQAVWGWSLFVGESMLAIGSGVAAAVSYFDQAQARDAFQQGMSTASAYQTRAKQAAIVGDAMAGGFFLGALAGIVQAEVTFVPERTYVRKRLVPPVSLRPILGPTSIGVAGAF